MANKKLTITDCYALFALSMQFILQILFAYVLKIDAAGRLSMFLLFSAFFFKIVEDGRSVIKAPILIYCFIGIYLFINGIVQLGYLTYEVSPVLQMFRKTITPPVFLILCSIMLQSKEKETIKVLFYTMCLYLAAYCLFKFKGFPSEINQNSAALVLIADVILLCYGRMTKLFGPGLFVAATVMFLAETIVIGSRMGLATVFYLYMVFALLKRLRTKDAISIIIFVLSIIVLTVFIVLALNFTRVGERMMDTTEQVERFTESTGTVFDKFGDRGIQYYYSWPYFIKNPIFGIGLNNWILYNPVDTVCHSEYLVQYMENGLVAFIPYVLFLYLLMHSLRREYRKRAGGSRTALKFVYLSMFGILFCNSVIWTNDQYAVFIVYALCFALSRQRRMYRIQSI